MVKIVTSVSIVDSLRQLAKTCHLNMSHLLEEAIIFETSGTQINPEDNIGKEEQDKISQIVEEKCGKAPNSFKPRIIK